jgi:hypothetical protein
MSPQVDAGSSIPVQRAHTADLNAAERARIRTFLDEAFDGDFTDDDWEHALGGVHAWRTTTASSSATRRSSSAASSIVASGSERATPRLSQCTPAVGVKDSARR